jgi:Protein of unknown function (DUF2829).
MKDLSFSAALNILKSGGKIVRKGWSDKGMFIYLTSGSIVPFENLKQETANKLLGEKTSRNDGAVEIKSHIDMKTADGSITIGWVPSQVDMLADDWEVVA